MACSCKNCAAGFWARYCIATRELTPAETARVEQVLARRGARLPSPSTDAPSTGDALSVADQTKEDR